MADGWAIFYGRGLKCFTFEYPRALQIARELHGILHSMSYDMNVSQVGLTLIKDNEECILFAYPDPASPLAKELQRLGIWRKVLDGLEIPEDLLVLSGAPWTMGWGRAHGVKHGDTCTQDQADAWIQEDADTAARAVIRHTVPMLEQNQLDALASFVFNLGEGNFANSTLLKKVNAEDWEGAAAEFLKWDHAAGRQMAGLTKRRLAESELFLA